MQQFYYYCDTTQDTCIVFNVLGKTYIASINTRAEVKPS